MFGLDMILGPILLGTVLDIWLYGVMVTQTAIYYVTFKRDYKWIKILVAYLVAINTLSSAFYISFVWRYTISLFGDLKGLSFSYWSFNVEPIMTVMISSAAQCFFAWRVVKLTGKVWLGWLIGVSAFVQFAAGTGLTIGLFIVGEFSRFQELRAAVIIWLVLSAITDILITCILVWYLRTHRTGFSQTDDVISRVVRLTVQTGLITTIWATMDLILYLALDNNMHLVFQLPLCKLYTNSLTSTLNCRTGWGGNFSPRGVNSQGSESEGSTRQSRRVSVWNPDQSKMNSPTGIQVVTVATVHRDDEVELEESGSDVAKKKSRLSRDL